ncbi:MAG: hypothetical protein ACR2QG_05385 [Gammaproteobacteria bacterium]
MKTILDFFKTTVLGGLIVIVPLAIAGIVIAQVIVVIIDLNAKLAGMFPYEFLNQPIVLAVLGTVLVVVLCFLTGLMLITTPGEKLLMGMTKKLEQLVPMFGLVRTVTARFAGMKDGDFSPVELDLYGSESRLLGFLIEKLPDDRVTVYVPSVPALTIGQIFVVPATSIKELDVPPALLVNAVTQWGVESKKLYSK